MIGISLVTSKIESYRLVRTTFWTRKLKQKRPDESDDFEDSNHAYDNRTISIVDEFNPSIEINQFHMQLDVQTKETATAQPMLKRVYTFFLDLFCGFDTSSLETQKENESKRRIESFNSLNQPKFELYILNGNLILILIIAIGLFIFFSIPPQYHIFKHIHFNQTFIHKNVTN